MHLGIDIGRNEIIIGIAIRKTTEERDGKREINSPLNHGNPKKDGLDRWKR